MLALTRHPDLECDAVTQIAVEASRSPGGVLTLRYQVKGAIAGLHLPEPKPGSRADELWRRTCFEAFVRNGAGAGYAEFNFAPSGDWAAYRFSAYRNGMSPIHHITAPTLEQRRANDLFVLEVVLDLDGGDFAADQVWRLGLSAVIEETNGALSYWALGHPPGEPDFHHADCFALELAPPLRL